MNIPSLIRWMDRRDTQGAWVFGVREIELAFPRESLATLRSALRSHTDNGILVRITRGLYANPRARSRPSHVLSALVGYLRPYDFNYIGLESAASEYGLVSQVPGRLTVVTSGRPGTIQTPWGTLEFVHVGARPGPELTAGVHYDELRQISVSTPEQTVADLRRFRRSMDLIAETHARTGEHA